MGYYEYMESIARNHKEIGHTDAEPHYAHIEIGELDNLTTKQMSFAALAAMSPTYQMQGNHSNLRWEVQAGVFVIDKVERSGYFEVWKQTQEKCRRIADEIRAKMVKDRKLYELNNQAFALPGLDETSFQIRSLAMEYDPMAGVMLTFRYNEPAERFDLSKWNNETDYSI